jgi:hypothetical protein
MQQPGTIDDLDDYMIPLDVQRESLKATALRVEKILAAQSEKGQGDAGKQTEEKA